MNPGYMGYGRTEVCSVSSFRVLDCTMHARTEGLQRVTWWLLAVFDLDESLVGMTSEVFRLLFGVFFFVILGSFRCREMGRGFVRLNTCRIRASKHSYITIHNNFRIHIECFTMYKSR